MTSETRHLLTPLSSFIDESFDVKRTNDLHLVLQIGLDGIQITALDIQKNKYIAFEYFSFQNVFSFDLVVDLLDKAVKESKLLGHTYRSVSCSLVSPLATLVPDALFDEDSKTNFLTFNSSLKGDESILADNIPNLGAKNVFAFPLVLKTKLDTLFSKISYHHFSSTLIDGLLAQTRNQSKKQLFVHICSGSFQVLAIEGKKLLFYNSFNHHTPEDLIYYLLFVCESLNLNPEHIETTILGEIEKTSAIYTVMQKYIRNIKFGSRIDNADLSYQLQTFPRHYYYSLFNNYLN